MCRNPAQARKDAADREAILAGLAKKLNKGAVKELIGSKGYARFLKAQRDSFEIDVEKAREEEKYDGLWLLRTNTPFEARETVLRYKQLWMVEQTFRTAKALLDTRPAFHRTDATIRGHVFCSFLAMVLQKELFRRMEEAGVEAEWADIVRDLNAVTETQLEYDAKRFVLRSKMQGVAGKIVQCVGVRLPNTIRQVDAPQGGDARSAA